MTTQTILSCVRRAQHVALRLRHDCRGIAAVEFAVIVPMMLVMFFGTIEISSGVAVDRKVTLVSRTISDLASQSTSVQDSDISNFFTIGNAIMTPFSPTPIVATVSELYVDPTTLVARVQWSKGSAARVQGSAVTVPVGLKAPGTYLLFSEVNYRYVPTVGYVMGRAGVTLSDQTYTRPRQSICVFYPSIPSNNLCPTY